MRNTRVNSQAIRVQRTTLLRERRGAMLVFIAVSGVVLMGFLAMTLDLGAGTRQRRIAQTAADAGAIGGGQEILRSGVNAVLRDSVINAATNEAIRNGFAPADITVGYPPASGTFAGDSQYVEVIINKSIPTIFGAIFNISSMAIQAHATAGVSSFSLKCVIALDPTGAGAITVANGANLVTDCGVAVNSDNPNALDLNNSGDLDARPSGIGIRGGYTAGGGASALPAPQTGTASYGNPLANIQMPIVGACDHTGLFVVTGTMTLNPGVYCGGISVTNASNTANLRPGTYILAGGGLTVTNSGVINTVANGAVPAGVTLINTTNATYAFQPFTFGNGCKAKLSASTTGPYKGILMFQDPLAPSTPDNVFACSSTSAPELTGILYFPNSTIRFDGSDANTEVLGGVIAKQVIVSGKIKIINDVSGGSVLRRLALVR